MKKNNSPKKDLERSFNLWKEEKYKKALENDFSIQKEYSTVSGRKIKSVYTPLDLENFDYLKQSGFPGEFPYTRGVHPTMYRGRLWTMRQFSGFGTAEDTNKRYKYLLSHGQTGLSVAFHLPTLMGID
ncbi:MAG: methylmalonyl-CoA mutase family protein, partial [Candidatus Aminicenantaceae bacterium]